MRWVALAIIWLAGAAATVGTAYFTKGTNVAAAALVALFMSIGATIASIVITVAGGGPHTTTERRFPNHG